MAAASPSSPPCGPSNVDVGTGITTLGVSLALLLAAATTIILVMLIWRSQRLRRLSQEQNADMGRTIREAIATTSSLPFPATFVRASDFVNLGHLVPHEELRDAGKLIYWDHFAQLHDSINHDIIFLSHQWTAVDHPDPTGTQYRVMVSAIHKVESEIRERRTRRVSGSAAYGRTASNGEKEGKPNSFGSKSVRFEESQVVSGDEEESVIRETFERLTSCSTATNDEETFRPSSSPLDDVLIWVDYSCIPQRSVRAQNVAIQAISAYCSCATAFVVIAPNVEHAVTGEICNHMSYQSRMWCRAEQLCHVLRNGVDRLWLATSEMNCELMAPRLDMNENDHAEVRASVSYVSAQASVKSLSEMTEMGNSPERGAAGSPLVDRRRDWEKRWLDGVLHVFSGKRSRVGDAEWLVAPILGLYAELYAAALHDRGGELSGIPFLRRVRSRIQAQKRNLFPQRDETTGRRLFGELVLLLERTIDEDSNLRNQLHAQVYRRRGLQVQLSRSQRASSRSNRKRSLMSFLPSCYASQMGLHGLHGSSLSLMSSGRSPLGSTMNNRYRYDGPPTTGVHVDDKFSC